MTARRRDDQFTWQDAEDLEDFASELHALGIHASGMEPAGSPTYETPSFPGWMESFGARSNGARARAVWRRLLEASALYAPAATVIMALHSPAAVMCDGKRALSPDDEERAKRDPTFRWLRQLDVGRRLAVYPCTWTADEARRWCRTRDARIAVDKMGRALAALSGVKRRPGPQADKGFDRVAPLLTLDGRRPWDMLTAFAAAKAAAKGREADVWREIDDEAKTLITATARAWNETPTHREKRVMMRTDKLGVVAA